MARFEAELAKVEHQAPQPVQPLHPSSSYGHQNLQPLHTTPLYADYQQNYHNPSYRNPSQHSYHQLPPQHSYHQPGPLPQPALAPSTYASYGAPATYYSAPVGEPDYYVDPIEQQVVEPAKPKTEPKKGPVDKHKGILRQAAGQRWRDPTLDEWPENDYRLFVGDLGNEVNDDLLAKHFQKYPTFAKAKVVRDKRSNKTKGYGFVSFLDVTDFAKAFKQEQGKYVGNRPIKLRKSTWEERLAPTKKNKNHHGGQGKSKQKK